MAKKTTTPDPKNAARDVRIALRVTGAEARAIAAAADRAQRSVSDWIRLELLQAVK